MSRGNMETFTIARDFIDDPGFETRRAESLRSLDLKAIDAPLADIITRLGRLPYCFTLQCCWGHFVHSGQTDPHGLEPLADYSEDTTAKYRIAYLAVCIQKNEAGSRLHTDLKEVVRIEPRYIQFGSADWFWRQHTNSYVLQVEPERFKFQDTAVVGITEALDIQSIRDRMFEAIQNICLLHGGQ